MQLVWDNLAAKGPEAGHDAHFVCALALAWPDGHVEAFEGRVDGLIIWPPSGANGFGYDPIFEPKGHNISFGEMEPDRKHAMSHRADAFAKRSEEHTSELQSLMRLTYAVFCLKKKKRNHYMTITYDT